MTTAQNNAVEEGPEAPATRGRARKYTQVLAVIYQAAVEVFAADGLAGASTQAIADKAGLSKAQLHYYIESKEALYRQVLQDIINDWIGVFGFSDEAFGPRKVLTRDDIMAAAPAESADAFDRSIDSRIVRLRRKLDTERITTIRGSGYRFDPPAGA